MKRRGRPKGGSQISHELILSAAFGLLDESGHKSLTMRTLARRLGVTPMALYGHFPDRDALVRGMSDAIYLWVVTEFEASEGSPRRQLKNLLSLYYEAVVHFPQLTVLIFSSPSEFSEEVQQINYYLSNLLAKSNLKAASIQMWLEILVDFTHGSALATASARSPEKNFMGAQKLRYQQQLEELFSRIF